MSDTNREAPEERDGATRLARLHLWQIQGVRDVVVVAVVLAIVYLGYAMRSVSVPLLVAFGLAYLVEPVVQGLVRRFNMTRTAAVGTLMGTAGVALVAVLAIMLPIVVGQSASFVQAFRQGRFNAAFERAEQLVPEQYRGEVERVKEWFSSNVSPAPVGVSNAGAKNAEAAVRSAKLDLDRCKIYSPVAGVVPSLAFRQQELVCHDESAFDGLIRGDGCTWVAVIKVYPQRVGLKDVNSFFGNLRNGQKYEGIWGCLDDDNTVWWGARNGLTFGRFDVNNPKLSGPKLEEGRFHFIAGRLGAGQGEVPVELFVNSLKPCATGRFPVNPQADASKLSIGQERDATQHPGKESFDGEIARFLLWNRPLTDEELKSVYRQF
jgi:hypothetical protein